MYQFIDANNQTLLWETINKTPLINVLTPNERPEWFKTSIQQYYHNNNIKNMQYTISKEDLQLLNKKTIVFLVDDLKKRTTYIPFDPPSPPPDDVNYRIIKTKKDLNTNELFEKKQKEYDELYHPPTPAKIDFQMKEVDEPIKDISKLVEKHLREREEELTKYAGQPPSLKIENENIQLNPTEIEDVEIPNKKKVHWREDVVYQTYILEYFDEIKEKIIHLEEKVNAIYDFFINGGKRGN